jgi:Flp pilus assembly protein TadG
LKRLTNDRGAVTVLMLLLSTALFALGGLVVDGGRALTARERAVNHAEQAARAGAAALSESELRRGVVVPNPAAARTAALAFLRRTGDRGTVSVLGNRVTVRVETSTTTVLLGLVGVRHFTVAGSASARPVRGIEREG